MKINVGFTETFDVLIDRLKRKYPKEVFDINGISEEKIDVMNFSNKFFHNSANLSDITVDGNANVSERNMVQYNYEINKGLMRMKGLAMLHKQIEETYTTVVANNAIEKVINGELFVNDLHLVNLPYCYAFDIAQLLIDGMDFYGGMMKIRPPKRSDSLIDLVIQTTASLSNQVAGAVSYPSLFILIDAFYRRENGENYMQDLRDGNVVIAKKIRDQFQKLIYSLNFTFRGNQSAFTNVSVLDDGFLDYLFDDTYVLPNGWEINKSSTKELSKYFYEYFSEINMKEGMFTFPVVTIALSVDDNNEFIDKETVEWTAKVNSAKSLANIMIDKPTSFSSCCRLRNDFTKLNAYGRQNSFGVGGVSVGSHRVVGLNLPRIALSGVGVNKIYELLSTTKILLDAHRDIINKIIDSGALPLYTKGWMSLSRQYSTVGFVGLYEFMHELGVEIDTDSGIEKASDFMSNIEHIVESWQTKDRLYNIEQIPAESTAVRLAKIDQLLVDGKYNIYSNQYLPLTKEASIYNRIKLQGVFDKNTSGGAILHINFDENKPMSPKTYMTIMESARELGCKYFGVNYVFSKCENDHYVISNGDMCPVCGCKIVDKYTRVVGFLTSVNNWNQVRREEEFPNRKFTTTEGIMGDL